MFGRYHVQEFTGEAVTVGLNCKFGRNSLQEFTGLQGRVEVVTGVVVIFTTGGQDCLFCLFYR